MIDRPFDMVRQRMVTSVISACDSSLLTRYLQESGTAKPCFTTSELDEWMKSGRDPEHARLIKGVAGTSYAGNRQPSIL